MSTAISSAARKCDELDEYLLHLKHHRDTVIVPELTNPDKKIAQEARDEFDCINAEIDITIIQLDEADRVYEAHVNKREATRGPPGATCRKCGKTGSYNIASCLGTEDAICYDCF